MAARQNITQIVRNPTSVFPYADLPPPIEPPQEYNNTVNDDDDGGLYEFYSSDPNDVINRYEDYEIAGATTTAPIFTFTDEDYINLPALTEEDMRVVVPTHDRFTGAENNTAIEGDLYLSSRDTRIPLPFKHVNESPMYRFPSYQPDTKDRNIFEQHDDLKKLETYLTRKRKRLEDMMDKTRKQKDSLGRERGFIDLLAEEMNLQRPRPSGLAEHMTPFKTEMARDHISRSQDQISDTLHHTKHELKQVQNVLIPNYAKKLGSEFKKVVTKYLDAERALDEAMQNNQSMDDQKKLKKNADDAYEEYVQFKEEASKRRRVGSGHPSQRRGGGDDDKEDPPQDNNNNDDDKKQEPPDWSMASAARTWEPMDRTLDLPFVTLFKYGETPEQRKQRDDHLAYMQERQRHAIVDHYRKQGMGSIFDMYLREGVPLRKQKSFMHAVKAAERRLSSRREARHRERQKSKAVNAHQAGHG